MARKSVAPSIREVTFDCPHCGAYTTQTWYDVYARNRLDENQTPALVVSGALERIRADNAMPPKIKADLLKALEKQIAGLLYLDPQTIQLYVGSVLNLHLSQCFNCRDFSVWVHDRLLFPASRQGPPPHSDAKALRRVSRKRGKHR